MSTTLPIYSATRSKASRVRTQHTRGAGRCSQQTHRTARCCAPIQKEGQLKKCHHLSPIFTFGVEISKRAKLMKVVKTLGKGMVPRAGVEPARPFGQRILSPQRLPFRHPGMLSVREFYQVFALRG